MGDMPRDIALEIERIRGKILSDKSIFGKFRAVMNPEEIAYEIAQELKNKGLEEEAKKYFQKLEEMENERLRYEKDYKLWKEYRMEKLKNILLSELSEAKLEKRKIILRRSYEELKEKDLSDYTPDEIIYTLKSLEKQVNGKNRKKVKALKKEIEAKEGISKHKKLLALAAAGIMIGAAGYAIYEMNKKPENPVNPVEPPHHNVTENPEINSVYYPNSISTNSKLPIKINATADEVFVDMLINGALHNYTANKTGGNFTLTVPVKEGVYEIEDVYAVKGNKSAKKEIDAVLKAFDKPVIHGVIYSKDMEPGETAKIELNATDTSGIAKALMLVTDPTGKKFHVSGKEEEGLYVFEFPLTKEPLYSFNISVSDPFNQTSYYNGSISSLDSPSINYFEIKKLPDKGLAEIELKAIDTSGIAKAVIQLNGENESMTKLPNGSYVYNVFMGENPENLTLKVYVSDPFNQTSNVSGEINWLLEDAYTYWVVKNKLNKTISLQFLSKAHDAVSDMYRNDKGALKSMLYLATYNGTSPIDGNVAYKLLRQILDNETIPKDYAFNKSFPLMLYTLKQLNLKGPKRLETIKAIEKYSLAGYYNLPKNNRSSLELFNFTEKNPYVVNFKKNVVWDNFTLPFDMWYLVKMLNYAKNETEKYPFAAREYVKQVDALTKNWIINGNESTRNEVVNLTMDNWKFQTNIWEKGERVLPLEKELLLQLFGDENTSEIALRQSLLPPQVFYVKINQTETMNSQLNTDYLGNPNPTPSLKFFENNIKKLKDYHNFLMYVLRYRASNRTELYEFFRNVAGWDNNTARVMSYYFSKMLELPDPIKVFIVSWNRFLTDQLNNANETITLSSDYKYILLNEGVKIPWFEVKIRGDRYLSPENQSSQPIGIAPIQFKDGNLTYEQIFGAITTIALYSHTYREETRVEAAEVAGWAIGLPSFRWGTDYSNFGHGDTGMILPYETYQKVIRELNNNSLEPFLPLRMTNGWIYGKEPLIHDGIKSVDIEEILYSQWGKYFKFYVQKP
ncbi:hypothetical protein ABOONEI_538 [Aciduliprofundum boonei T469]|nr:hypothetical protein ABOONEI_538 [Aciduliprofundum boonei T469]